MDSQQNERGMTMEPKLHTYSECMDNIRLFREWKHDSYRKNNEQSYHNNNGMTVYCYDKNRILHYFCWFHEDNYHRIDGPAFICHNNVEWYFLGGRVDVDSQAEFEQWLIDKL